MGRMLARGYGRELYDRNRQWEVVRDAFPMSAEAEEVRRESILPPADRVLAGKKDDILRHDAEWMMWWFMGADDPEWKTAGGAVAAALAPGRPARGLGRDLGGRGTGHAGRRRERFEAFRRRPALPAGAGVRHGPVRLGRPPATRAMSSTNSCCSA